MDEKSRTFDFEAEKERMLSRLSHSEQQKFIRSYERALLRTQIAELVFETRIGLGLTQTQLACFSGTSQSVISSVENGIHLPRLVTLMRIAEALKLPFTLRFGVGMFSTSTVTS
jgi:DNA-binding XRE family transcriptional regulator